MRIEHFGRDELKQSVEQTDNRTGALEAGKTLSLELPTFGNSVIDLEDKKGWKTDDSERELAEFPNLYKGTHANGHLEHSDKIAFGSKAGENMALRRADEEYAKNGDTARYRQYLKEAAKEHRTSD